MTSTASPSGDGNSAATSSDEALSVTSTVPATGEPLTTNTVMSMSIAPTTGGQGESGPNAGLIAGVVVGVVLALVVVVVVPAAIVLAVCSTQQRRKRSGQTYDVPAVALSVADDSGIALIRNPAYDEAKKLMSSATEASSVQYDYARPTDIAPGVMGHETSAHDAVLLYEPMSDTPPATVSINTHSCTMTTA